MDRRRALASGLIAALLLVAVVAPGVMSANPKCESARKTLSNNPDILAFKKCAGKKPIAADCCRKLLPFAEYAECVDDPQYKKEINQFLGGATTVDDARKACLS